MTHYSETARSVILALAGSTVLMAGNALAADEASEAKADRIEVTGSRIKRTDIETASPLLSISREDIDRSGHTMLSEVLKNIASNGASLGLQTNNGNTGGVARVNLRNCGSNQNLVLVNSRRWVANLGGNVDLTTIPIAAVERIDVLKDGASAIYGTDAICGVINVITRKDYDGSELRAVYGQTSESDGEREQYSWTTGSTSDKSSSLLNISYTNQKEILGGDREVSSVPIFGLPANISSAGGRASPTTPYGQFRVGTTSMTLDPANAGCAPGVQCQPSTASQFRAYNPLSDGYNFAPVNYITQPNEELSVFAQGTQQFLDNLEGRVEAVYHQRETVAQLAAQPLGGLAISATNFYNPFGTNIVGASFRPIVAPREFGAEVQTWRFGAALEGDFTLFDQDFSWDVGYIYSEQNTVQLKKGFFNSTRMTEAIGPSNAAGQCLNATTNAVISGCVPFNLFGGPNGVTAAMLDYVTVQPRNLSYSDLQDYTANLTGSLFEMPGGAGPFSFAVGYEKRMESGNTNPDPLTQANQVLGDNPVLPTVGGYSSDEYYLEFNIPVLADMPMAHSLEFGLSTRSSDYSTYGSTDNSGFSMMYKPIAELLIRASYNEGFRAPSIAELFAGQATGRPAATDPCSTNSTAYTTNPTVRANCAAAGVSTTFIQLQPQPFATSGGNPNLQPETSISKNFGLVYNPSFIQNFSATLDWFNIQIESSIGALSAAGVLNQCYVQSLAAFCANITRDFTGTLNGNPGELSGIFAANRNFIGGNEYEGVDFNVSYRFDTQMGAFGLTLDSTYMIFAGDVGQLERGEINADGFISGGNAIGNLTSNASGGGSNHRVKSNLTFTWNMDDWSAAMVIQYMSKQRESCSNVTTAATALGQPGLRALCSDPDNIGTTYSFAPGSSTDVVATTGASPLNELAAIYYVDLTVGYALPWNATIGLGINNVTDEDPPLAFSAFANTYDPQYRTPGQYYYATYKQSF